MLIRLQKKTVTTKVWGSLGPAQSTKAPTWRLSLGVRFALTASFVLSAVFLVLYLGLSHREKQRLVSSKTAAGGMLADVFARTLQGPIEFHDEDAIASEMRTLDSNRAIRSVLVWADEEEPIARLGAPMAAPKPQGDSVRVEDGRIVLVRQVRSRSGSVIGEVLIDMSLDEELATYRRTRVDLLLGAAVMALGTSALLVAIVRREIVMPLRRLGVVATAIGDGELWVRTEAARRDEIGDLSGAFNQMAASLEDRELRLEAVGQNLRELVDHMRQGIVAFDSTGRVVSEGSREALRLFGSEDLKGRLVRELLYGDAPAFDVDVQAFDEWRELAFTTAPRDWEQVFDLAPKELVVGPERVPVTLELRPIVRNGRVLQVMLLATDVTRERHLERAVQTKDEEYARRIKAMRRLLTGGSQAVVAFVESAQDRLSGSLEMITSCRDVLPTAIIDALFRSVHTVRGEARAFDMRDLERNSERVEGVLDEFRAAARGQGYDLTEDLRAQLAEAFQTVLTTLHRERDLFAEASPIGRAIFSQTTVQTQDLAALERYAERAGGEVGKLVERLRARPLGESAAGIMESAPTWALAEGKRVDIVVEHGDIMVDPALGRILPGILAHLVRNAIAHGIEVPDERVAAGKPPEGVVRVSAVKAAAGTVSIVVEDDGRGLDMDALRVLAPQMAGPVEEVIFAAGVSTRRKADHLAGRGVGLDAVRTELTGIGYTISVATERSRYTRFTVNDNRAPAAASRES